jgi:uncharacterized protein YjbI with pentapeptide repeats
MASDVEQLEVLTKLKELGDLQSRTKEFVGADLRGVDLAEAKLNLVNLAGARLDGANLTNARLSNVILTGTRFRGAKLQGAELFFVEATQADLSEADASHSRWQHASLLAARFDRANLTRALFRNCVIDNASLENVTLSGGGIVHSTCDEANFSRARLTNLETVGSSFQGASFEEAEQFLLSREIIAEILRRHINREIEQVKLVGASLLMGHWCYAEWKQYLTTPDMEAYYALALDILSM